MKIKPEHCQHIRAAILPIAHLICTHREKIDKEYRAKDVENDVTERVEKRVRWDFAYAAGLTPWICSTIYPYANDDHFDTALKKVFSEICYEIRVPARFWFPTFKDNLIVLNLTNGHG